MRPTNVYILRQSDPTGVELSDHPQTAQFGPLEVGLNVGCDNPTHEQSDPVSAPPGGGGRLGHYTQMVLLKKWCCATSENFTHAWVSRAQA